MNYRELEIEIDDLIKMIKKRRSELDPEVSGEDDLINELEKMKWDLETAINRIERLKKLENKI